MQYCARFMHGLARNAIKHFEITTHEHMPAWLFFSVVAKFVWASLMRNVKHPSSLSVQVLGDRTRT
jgi:hypothetical protein